jgi:hypothetical protein
MYVCREAKGSFLKGSSEVEIDMGT